MISIFLAKLLGLYLVIVISGIFLNRKLMERIVKDFSDNLGLVYLSGFFSLLIGLLVVLNHNVWSADWKMIITLIGWLTLVKGIIRIFFPEKLFKLAKKFPSGWLNVVCAIFFVIGIYLTYIGFLLN